MAELSLQIEGVDRLIQKLGRAGSTQVLRLAVWRAGARVLTRLKTYPPERPNQSYQRTGALGAAWAISDSAGAEAASVTLANSIAYGPFVQKDPSAPAPHQAWMHRDRWATDQQALDAETGPFTIDLRNAIDTALRS